MIINIWELLTTQSVFMRLWVCDPNKSHIRIAFLMIQSNDDNINQPLLSSIINGSVLLIHSSLESYRMDISNTHSNYILYECQWSGLSANLRSIRDNNGYTGQSVLSSNGCDSMPIIITYHSYVTIPLLLFKVATLEIWRQSQYRFTALFADNQTTTKIELMLAQRQKECKTQNAKDLLNL